MKRNLLAVANFMGDLILYNILFQATVMIIVLSDHVLTATQQIICFVFAVIAVVWNEIMRRKEK